MGTRLGLSCSLLAVFHLLALVEGQCDLANNWLGHWYSYEGNSGVYLNFEERAGSDPDLYLAGTFPESDNFRCVHKKVTRTSDNNDGYESAIIVVSKPDRSCYGCMEIEERTPNILEYRAAGCLYGNIQDAEERCTSISQSTQGRNTAFRTTAKTVNCKETIEGVWQYEHTVADLTPLCIRQDNLIVACQEPGSPYKDNRVFSQTFNLCNVNDQVLRVIRASRYEYQCLGTWISTDKDKSNYVYSAIQYTQANDDESRYRCMLTFSDQQLEENRIRYSLSINPSCKDLKSDFDSSAIKIEARPVIDEARLEQLRPSCNLPKNFTGTWFTSSEYDSDVKINATHMHFSTRYSTFETKDTYFTCQETRDTRFLMKQVTQGRCEVEYVCFQFLPRHQNVLRYRIGKPYQGDTRQYGERTLSDIFSRACQWSAFTVSRDENRNYNYQILILNPPAPVICPIGGVYKFEQTGVQAFKYYTRIRGVTERPRVKVLCDRPESEWKSCSQDPKTVMLDVDRCATLDHVGRPIGEYDEPDNHLQCAGFWQENQQSYLVTYDTEDPVSLFRCWVYERYGWRKVGISRALRAACHPLQRPNSSSFQEGASLALMLTENEREFDDCPQRFYDGQNPYKQESTVYVLGRQGAGALTVNLFTTFSSILLCLLLLKV